MIDALIFENLVESCIEPSGIANPTTRSNAVVPSHKKRVMDGNYLRNLLVDLDQIAVVGIQVDDPLGRITLTPPSTVPPA